MGFLGGAPLSTPQEELETATERFQPTLGLSLSTAFEESRSLFGFKPLQDLSEIAKLRGHKGTELFGVNAGAFDLMRDKEIDGNPTSRLLDPDEANETFGIEGQLKFTVPISEDEAKFIKTRKLEEIERNYILQQNKGFMNNLATFGVEFVADITDPIGLATLLFPVTSFRTVAKLTQKAGKMMPYAVGMGEAAVGIAVPLTPGYFASQEFQYNFTPADYGVSLAGGVVLGGMIRRLIHMRDTKGLINMTKAEEDNLNASLDYHDQETKNVSQKVDDMEIDHAAERTTENNSKSRQHGATQLVEGKFDKEWMDSYLQLSDDLFRLGRTPLKENIDNYTDQIVKLTANKKELEALLKTIPEGKHRDAVKRILKHTEEYIKLNTKKRTKLSKRLKQKELEGTADPEPSPETAQQQAFEVSMIEYEITGGGSQTKKQFKGGKTKKSKITLKNKIKEVLGEELSGMLSNKKMKDAFEILSDVIKRDGSLTINNLVRALGRDNKDPAIVRDFLEKTQRRYEKPSNQEMSSGDAKAIDYQEGVDLTNTQREEHDINDDFSNDTEFAYRTPDEVAEAADDEHETVASLFEMMEKNVKSDKNPRGVYSEKVISMIKKRWANDELDDVKTENALTEYDRCARRNN